MWAPYADNVPLASLASFEMSRTRVKSRSAVHLLLALLICIAILVPAASSAPATATSVARAPSPTNTALNPSTSGNYASPTTTDFFILPTSAPDPPQSSTGNATLGATCPPPMVPNIHNLVSASCMGPCCLPCPVSSVFYEPNKLENVYTLTSILRAVSATACGILSICYLVLPSRRKHPHLIVLCFMIMMVPWEGLGTAWLYKKDSLLCESVYEIATMSNSWFCGLQGIALMYIVLVMLCLATLLIANLHVLTVYRSTLIQSHLTKLIVLSFFLPLSLVLPVAIRKQIENPGFGSICFVSSSIASPYFFYPLSVIVCIATLLHLATIAFMVKTSVKANSVSVSDSTSYNPSDSQSNKTMSKKQRRLQTARDISLLLKQQWRPGLFALCLLVIDMIYWLFYFIEAKKLESVTPTTLWFMEWTRCLGEQAMISMQEGGLSANSTLAQVKAAGDVAQAACAPIAYPFVPSFSWAALSDILPASFGVMILIIFGSKLELWQDLRMRLFGGRDSTVFVMGDITKDTRDRHFQQMQAQNEQQRQAQRTNQGRHRQANPASEIDLYSEELGLNESVYNSRDILAPLSQATYSVNSKPARLESSRAAPAVASSPTSPTTPNAPGLTYGRATRKTSIAIDEGREPVYYRSPGHEASSELKYHPYGQDSQQPEHRQRAIDIHQHRAQLVAEGSEPWPAWPSTAFSPSSPSSYPTSPVSPVHLSPSAERRTQLTVRTQGTPGHTGSVARLLSPVSPNFYNSDDLVASPTQETIQRGGAQQVAVPSRVSSREDRVYDGSGVDRRPQPQASIADGSMSSTRAFSPPPVPQKSGRRRV